jgi:antitoxin CcdA
MTRVSSSVASRGGRKAPTNLSVRTDLVQRARSLRLNLSELFEKALEAAIRDRESDAWLAENRTAVRAYNSEVEKRGVFSDGWRRF